MNDLAIFSQKMILHEDKYKTLSIKTKGKDFHIIQV